MKKTCAIALALSSMLVCSTARAGEDKQQRPDKSKTTDAAPAEENTSVDVDAFIKTYDRNKDGFLQRTELPSLLRDRFTQLDDNKDGKLSAEELRKHQDILEQWHRIVMHRRARMLDLVVYVRQVAESDEPCREMLQRVYNGLQQVDTNHDGKIDHDEWEAARKQLRERRIDALLERQGAAKEGKVSKEDARGRLHRHFDAWDLNHDGYVDREELRKAFETGTGTEQPVKTKQKTKTTETRDKE
jgi:Ca2+-binding EF-hand superfamily protein